MVQDKVDRLMALNKLAEVFDAKFAEARQAVYLEALDGVHTQNLIWACNQAAKTCEFFPVPAKLIEIAKRAPALPKPYNAMQITEITAEKAEENRAALQNMVKWVEEELEGRMPRAGLRLVKRETT